MISAVKWLAWDKVSCGCENPGLEWDICDLESSLSQKFQSRYLLGANGALGVSQALWDKVSCGCENPGSEWDICDLESSLSQKVPERVPGGGPHEGSGAGVRLG